MKTATIVRVHLKLWQSVIGRFNSRAAKHDLKIVGGRTWEFSNLDLSVGRPRNNMKTIKSTPSTLDMVYSQGQLSFFFFMFFLNKTFQYFLFGKTLLSKKWQRVELQYSVCDDCNQRAFPGVKYLSIVNIVNVFNTLVKVY